MFYEDRSSITKSEFDILSLDFTISAGSDAPTKENEYYTNTVLFMTQNIGINCTVAHYKSDEISEEVFSMRNWKNHHILWSDQLKTLTLKGFINNAIIDGFMMYNSTRNWKNVSFVPTDHTSYILGDFYDKTKPDEWLMYNLNFEFSGLIFLPYCYKSHYCLLVLNVEEKTIMHLDSLSSDDITGDRAIRAFEKYLRECE